MGLTWPDVAFTGKEPYCILWKRKEKTDRAVLLRPQVLKTLWPQKKDIVPAFTRVHPDTVTHWFREVAGSCGIKARLHDVRHTAGTYMMASGINPRVVQEILGNAQFAATELCKHVVKDHVRKELKKLRFE